MMPTPDMLQERDVLQASTSLVKASTVPVALGVHFVTEEGLPKSAPLYFVSKNVAQARNGDSVVPGWYVITKPGLKFTVVVTCTRYLNNEAFVLRLRVNGYRATRNLSCVP